MTFLFDFSRLTVSFTKRVKISPARDENRCPRNLYAAVLENVRNVIVNGNQVGCSYKEFLACNLTEYDGKGGAIVLTRWIEKMKSVQDMSGCSIDQKAFTVSIDVLEIFMQQFWYSIKKVQTSLMYHVDTTLAFLIKMGYKDSSHEGEEIKEGKYVISLIHQGEDYQEYGLSIPKTMLTEAIKQSESYQMFIKYSTGQIPPKKRRGKGSQRKKTADDSQEAVDVSKESEPEPVKRKTSSNRRFKKKVTLSADDNIIFDDLDTKVRQSDFLSSQTAQGCSISYSRRTRGWRHYASSKRKQEDKQEIARSKQESKYLEEDKLDDKEKDDKEGDADDEDDETESDEDDIHKYKIHVHKDEDEEILNAKVKDSDKGDEEVTDAAKADAEKTLEVKDDPKKTELPPIRSSLSISLDAEINSLLEVKIQFKVLHNRSSSMLGVLASVISEPSVLIPVQESPSIATITTLPPPSSTDNAALKEYDQKSARYQTMHANKYFNTNPSNNRLYHALMEALIVDKNAMDNGVADTVQDHKRKHDDNEEDNDEDPPAGPNQGKQTKRRRTKDLDSLKKPSTTKETPKGKALSKCSKTGKSTLSKEPVEEPITQVVMDDAGDDVVHDDDQPQDASKPKTTKTLNPEWFTQPLRPPTPDLEWNNLELEYHFQECFNALTDRLDLNNPEGDHYPFELSKPLPMQGHPGHLNVAFDYFFNNDLEYLKSFDPERMYTTSIMKVNKFSKHNVYSTKKIQRVKSVSAKKLHRYGYLEEIMVKRANRVIYEDLTKQKRVMRADELYKFLDGTLKQVQDELHHRIHDFCSEYNTEMPSRKRTAIDKKRSKLMVELIDKQMRERKIIRSLERLVGARELEMDYKLMTRTTRSSSPISKSYLVNIVNM
nr:reverse transcriptase domain-containing protein [Tanacetum cinerariifolium]